MKSKKNPKANLSNKGRLFFQIGLIIVLFAAWRGIEMKTYGEADTKNQKADYFSLNETMVPKVILPKKKLPKKERPQKKKAVQKEKNKDYKVVDNDKKITTPIFKPPKNTKKNPVPVDSIVDVVEPDIITMTFKTVKIPPVFPGCEIYDSHQKRKRCMSDKIEKFVTDRFDTDLAQELGLSEGSKRIQLFFTVNRQGKVVDIKAKAPHPRLKQEATQILEKLPVMKPGRMGTRTVNVKYTFPIIFRVR